MVSRERAAAASSPPFPWRAVGDGVRLTIRLTPKASSDAVGGIAQGPDGAHLDIRVRALPSDGAANTALGKLVAAWLGLAPRDVTLVAGAKSRLKTLHLAGDSNELSERLRSKFGP
jgi:uncharacterized protein